MRPGGAKRLPRRFRWQMCRRWRCRKSCAMWTCCRSRECRQRPGLGGRRPGRTLPKLLAGLRLRRFGRDRPHPREVLGKLLPRLKIASRCALDGKFLTVRGDLRAYKIHLGSGNILMEPNDQYLCIVPGRSEDTGGLFLPFEGDRMLAIILSKAFLLATTRQSKTTPLSARLSAKNLLRVPQRDNQPADHNKRAADQDRQAWLLRNASHEMPARRQKKKTT